MLVNILLIALNVLMIGAVWVVLGRMLVHLLRRLLLDGLPPEGQATTKK
jgi:hypothetical protein